MVDIMSNLSMSGDIQGNVNFLGSLKINNENVAFQNICTQEEFDTLLNSTNLIPGQFYVIADENAEKVIFAISANKGFAVEGSIVEPSLAGELFPQPDLVGMTWFIGNGWSYDSVTGTLDPEFSNSHTWITSTHAETLRDNLTPGETYIVTLSGLAQSFNALRIKLRNGAVVLFQQHDEETMRAVVVAGSSTIAADAIWLSDYDGAQYEIPNISIQQQ